MHRNMLLTSLSSRMVLCTPSELFFSFTLDKKRQNLFYYLLLFKHVFREVKLLIVVVLREKGELYMHLYLKKRITNIVYSLFCF